MIKMGIVDFAKMTITHHIKDQNTECNQKVTKIKRKEYNRKVRPDAAKRQQIAMRARPAVKNQLQLRDDNKDLEWLSWNWRTTELQKMFKNRKQMVLSNFNYCQKPLLPSPNQILTGIINAQIQQFKLYENNKMFNAILLPVNEMWSTIFNISKSDDIDPDKPLTHEVLSNPNHQFVKALVYIYSMQTFIFKEMNQACRKKDSSQIQYYGAFASALGYIVHCGNQKEAQLLHSQYYHKDANIPEIFYRGFAISHQEFEEKYFEGNIININGFASTTSNRLNALRFSIDGITDEEASSSHSKYRYSRNNLIPILLEIDFSG